MNLWAVVLAALVLLAAAYPYVQRAKHADARTLAAYFIFVSVFALAAAALYMVVAGVVVAAQLDAALENPAGALLFLIAIFAPAFLVARWQLKRPPHRPTMPR